jgi:hypothetical protein
MGNCMTPPKPPILEQQPKASKLIQKHSINIKERKLQTEQSTHENSGDQRFILNPVNHFVQISQQSSVPWSKFMKTNMPNTLCIDKALKQPPSSCPQTRNRPTAIASSIKKEKRDASFCVILQASNEGMIMLSRLHQ